MKIDPKNNAKKIYVGSLWIRDKYYGRNYFNRLLWTCKKIGDMRIDPEPVPLGVQGGENSEKYSKNNAKRIYLGQILIRDKFYGRNYFCRLLWTSKKIGDMKFDPEPVPLGVRGGENNEKYSKNSAKKIYLGQILIRDKFYGRNNFYRLL